MPRLNQENINVAQKRYIPEVLPSIDDLRLSMQPSMASATAAATFFLQGS
jgi:hypothetical protein